MSIPMLTPIQTDNEKRLATLCSTLVCALEDALEFIEGQVDVVDGDYGIPEPNRAMVVAGIIKDALARTDK